MKKNNRIQKNIPSEWKQVKFGDVLSVGSGKDYKHLDIGDVPVFGTGGYMLSVNKSLHSGETVFIGRKGTIDKPFYFKGDFWTVDTLFYTHKFKNTTAKYINNVFQKIDWKSHNEASGVPSLSKTTIQNIKLLLPPLPEQNRIVSVLETWDRMLEKLTKKIQIKKQIKKGLMQELLTGKKRLSGFDEKWKSVKLANIGIFSKGSGITKDELSEGGINAVRYGELYTKHNIKIKKIFSFIPKEIIQNTKKIQYGDILFAGSGETIDEIGKSATYLLKEDCYAGGDIIIFTPKSADSLFLAYFLNTGVARKRLRELGQGQSVVHIYKSDIENLEIPIPSTKEQKAIAHILTTTDQEITALTKKLSILKEQKRYLLNNLITGTIRTPENNR